MANATEELNFKIYLTLNLNNHMWPGTTRLGGAAPEFSSNAFLHPLLLGRYILTLHFFKKYGFFVDFHREAGKMREI